MFVQTLQSVIEGGGSPEILISKLSLLAQRLEDQIAANKERIARLEEQLGEQVLSPPKEFQLKEFLHWCTQKGHVTAYYAEDDVPPGDTGDSR